MYVTVVHMFAWMYACICNCVFVCVFVRTRVCVLLVMEPRAHCLYPHPRKCFWLWNLLLHCGLPLRWQDVVLVRPAVAPAAARRAVSLDLLRGSDSPLRLEQPAVAGQPAGASGYLATRALATGKRPAGGRKPEAGGEASRGLVCARTLSKAGRCPGPAASVSHGGGASGAAARGGPGPELALVGAAPHPAFRPSF